MPADNVFLACAATAPPLLAFAAYRFLRGGPAGGERVGALRLVAGNLLVLSVLASTLLLGLELYYRFAVDLTDGGDATKVSRRWFDRHWQRNNWDLRDDRPYRLDIPAGRRRVSFLGDSFTAGFGVADVGARFANRIRAARPAWDVHVLAGNGFETDTEQEVLERLLRAGYELDVVVLIYCFNDISPLVPGADASWARPGWLEPLARGSYALDFLSFRWSLRSEANATYFARVEQAYTGATWDRQRERLLRLQRTVEDAGGRFAAVTFPQLVRLAAGEREGHAMHERLEALWRERGVPHLDLLELFERHRGPRLVVNRYDDHPSAHAHALAADAILAFLETAVMPR